MRVPGKQVLVGGTGALIACAGILLRLNAKALSMETSAPTELIAPGGKSLGGSISFSFENTARTSALTDFGMVLLYAGAALVVVAISVWMLTPKPANEPIKSCSTNEPSPVITIPQRLRAALRWPCWKKEAEVAEVFRS